MQLIKSILGGGGNNVSAADAQSLINGDNTPFILDVRQPEEYRAGHIAGSRLIPLDQLGQQMNQLPQNRTILCVCASGSRSSFAARQLERAGYTVANLSGGMMAWQRAGLPVKKGSK